MLSQALKSLASSSIATYQYVLEPLGPWSPVKVSSILNSAHLKMGTTALNWWVWSIKVGVSTKIFACTSCAHYQAPCCVNSWIRPCLGYNKHVGPQELYECLPLPSGTV